MTGDRLIRMIGPVALAPALTIVVGLATLSCGNLDVTIDARTNGVSAHLTLRDASGTPRTHFASGDEIVFVLRVENHSREVQCFTLATPRKFDFIVRSPTGGEVWRWSHNQAVIQVLSSLRLEPGESIEFSSPWGQTDNREYPVLSGTYTAEGFVPTTPSILLFDDRGFHIR